MININKLFGYITVNGDIDRNNYKEYIGKKVNVKGNVNISNLELTKIPITFGYVTGIFWCSYNKITSLKGAPRIVGGRFDCFYNKLTTLKGAPKKVGGSFQCFYNKLTSLEGAPRIVGGSFNCIGNKVLFTEEDVGKVSKVGGNIWLI